MTISYFAPQPTTIEQLKQQYKKLAFLNHPDCGGDTVAMQAVNNEYDYLFPLLKDIHVNAQTGEQYTKESAEDINEWKDTIAALIALNMKDVLIEVIGSFLWLSGNTKDYKEPLKALNFKWHSKKIAWYLAPDNYHKRNHRHTTLEDIRGMYGSKTVDINSKDKDKEQKKHSALTA
jgi:hypothetical protein